MKHTSESIARELAVAKQGTNHSALQTRKRLQRIESDMQEAYYVSFSPVLMDDGTIKEEEVEALFEQTPDSLKKSVDIYEARHQLPEEYTAPNVLAELSSKGLEWVDPDCVRESRPTSNLWAFLTKATEMELTSHRVRLHLMRGQPHPEEGTPADWELYLTTARKKGVPLPDDREEDPVQWSRNESMKILEAYCLENDYLPVFSSPERTYNRFYGFADIRLMPARMANRIFSTGPDSGLDKMGYANWLFTPSAVEHGLPLWRVVRHRLLDPQQFDLVTRFLGLTPYLSDDGEQIGDGYGLSFPRLLEDEDVICQNRQLREKIMNAGRIWGDISKSAAERRAERYNKQVMRDSQIRWAAVGNDNGTLYPAAGAKGTLIPCDRAAIEDRLRMIDEETRQLYAEPISWIEEALSDSMEVVFLVKGDQVKIGADRVPTTGVSYLAITNVRGPKATSGSPSFKPVGFEAVAGSSQQIQFTEFKAYGDILKHMDRELDVLAEKLKTPQGIASIIDQAAVRLHDPENDETVQDTYHARDLLRTLVRSNLIRLDAAGYELQAQGKPVPSGHLEMPFPAFSQVNKVAGEAVARILRTFGAIYPGIINHTCGSSLTDYLYANNYTDPLMCVARSDEAPERWQSIEYTPTVDIAGRTYTSFSAEPEVHKTVRYEVDLINLDDTGRLQVFKRKETETGTFRFDRHPHLTERRLPHAVHSRGVSFLPKAVVAKVNGDDDGDMVIGMSAITASGRKERFYHDEPGKRRRFTTADEMCLVTMVSRYPQVDAPVFWAGPTWLRTPFLAKTKEQEDSFRSYLHIFRPIVPEDADLQDRSTIVIMESNRTLRLQEAGVTESIDKQRLNGAVSLHNLVHLIDRKWRLNKTGKLTRNLERFLALEQECYIRMKKYPSLAEVAPAYRERASRTQEAIELELKALKYDIHQADNIRLTLPKHLEAKGFEFTSDQEVREAVPLDYHTDVRRVKGILALYEESRWLSVEELIYARVSGFGKETRAINSALSGHKQKGKIVAGGAGRTLISQMREIHTELWPFVQDLKKQARPLTEEENLERIRLNQAIEEWRFEWGAFMQMKNEALSEDDSDENRDLWKERTARRYAGMRRFMAWIGRRASRQALIHAILEDWIVQSEIEADNRQPSLSATMALLGSRAPEIFPLAGYELTAADPTENVLPVYARIDEIKSRTLPGKVGDFVGGTVRYNREKDLFLLHMGKKAYPLHIAERADPNRPGKGRALRFFRIRNRSGVIVWT